MADNDFIKVKDKIRQELNDVATKVLNSDSYLEIYDFLESLTDMIDAIEHIKLKEEAAATGDWNEVQ